MLYDAYEKRIQRVAKVKSFIIRFKILLSSILIVCVAAVTFVLVAKGNVTGSIELPPVISYGEDYNGSASAMFTSDIEYEYMDPNVGVWTSVKPTKAGEYYIRAVTNKSFGKKGYSKPQLFTIKPLNLEISLLDNELIYGIYPTKYTSKGLLASDHIEFIEFYYEDIKQEKTYAKVNLETLQILNNKGEDVTTCYNVICVNNEIKFDPSNLTITLDSFTKVYDGQELPYNNTFAVTSSQLYNGDILSIKSKITDSLGTEYQKIINAGEYKAEMISYEVKNGDTAVTHHYKVKAISNSLVINKRPITIYTDSISRNYNALALTAYTENNYGISQSSEYPLVEGHKLQLIEENLPTITKVGSIQNTLLFKIVDAEGNDVTDNYNISYEYGTLEVLKTPITVTTSTDKFLYDGDSHLNQEFIYDIDLPEGETIELVGTTPTITNVGIIENSFLVDIKNTEESVYSNYEVTYVYGQLEVYKRAIELEASLMESVLYNDSVFNYPENKFETISDLKIIESDFNKLLVNVEFRDSEGKSVEPRNAGKYYMYIVGTNGELDNNYDISYSTKGIEFEITKRNIKVAPISDEINYCGLNYQYSKNLEILSNNYEPEMDLVDGHNFAFTINYLDSNNEKMENSPINVGNYTMYINTINISSGDDDVTSNYNINYETISTLIINKQDITIKPKQSVITYNDTVFAYDSNEFDIVSGDIADIDKNKLSINVKYYQYNGENQLEESIPLNVGNYIMMIDSNNGILDQNYNINYEYETLTINHRMISVAAYNKTHDYDGNVFVYTSGANITSDHYLNEKQLIAGHDIVIQVTFEKDGTYYSEPIYAGNYNILITNISINKGSEDVTSNYDINLEAATLTINKRIIEVEASIPDQYREVIYNGNEYYYDSSWYEVVSENDILSTDTGLLIEVEYYNEEKQLLSNIPVDAGIYYVLINNDNGALNDNYVVNYSSEFVSFEIKKLEITIKPYSDIKDYDREYVEYNGFDFITTSANLIIDKDLGVLEIQVAYRNSNNEIVDPINAGEYIIEIASRNDALDRNYIINYETGSLVINRREIKIEANIPEEYQQVIYSGNEYQFDPSWYKVVPEDGILEYDQALGLGVLKVQYYDEGQVEMNEVPVNAGNYYVRIKEDNHVLDDNYKVSYSENYTWFEIQRRDIYIKPIDQVYEYNGEVIIYDTSSWEYAGESEGNPLKQFVNLDTVTTITSTYIDIIDVGVYDIYVDSLLFEGYLESNYNIHCESGIVEITPREITIKPKDISIVYNGEYYSLGEEEYEVISDKKIASRDEGNLRIYVRFIDENNDQVDPIEVGEYVIEITGTNGALDHNYIINYETGKLEITQAEITIKPKDIEKTYDRELINQENIGYEGYEVVDGKGEIYSRDLGKLTIDIIFKDSMGEVTPINAGEYIIEIASRNDALDRNYIINYETGSLVINRREITIEANIPEEYQQVIYSGNEYQFDPSWYKVVPEDGILEYDQALGLGVLKVQYYDEGQVEMNEVPVNAGNYYVRIIEDNHVLDDNYKVSYSENYTWFEIQRRDIYIKPIDQVYEYNGEIIIYDTSSWEYAGESEGNPLKQFVNLDTVTTITSTYIDIIDVGVYDIYVDSLLFEGYLESNYNIHCESGIVEITPREITIKPKDISIVYNGEYYSLGEEEYEVISDKKIASRDEGNLRIYVRFIDENNDQVDPIEVGEYVIEITGTNGALDHNYIINYETGKLEITQAEITIKPKDIEKTYDRELINQENIGYEGYEVVDGKGEIYSRDLGKLTIDIIFKDSMGEVTPINAGEYIIEIASRNDALDRNYIINYETGSLVINRREITIEANIPEEYQQVIYSGNEYQFDPSWYKVVPEDGILEYDQALGLGVLKVQYYDEGQVEMNEVPVNAGNYYVRIKEDNHVLDDNYKVSYSENYTWFEIQRRDIYIKPIDQVYEYNGEVIIYDTSSWEYAGESEGNPLKQFVNLDTVTTITSTYIDIIDVGVYDIYVDSLLFEGYLESNYNIHCESGIVEITPREITIKPKDISIVYNGEYYSLGEEEYEVISDKKIASRDEGNLRIYVRFIDENNDQVDPIEVGEYVIEITGTNGALDHNYIINYETGKLEITQAEITIKPKDIEKTYDRELINQENIGYEGYEVVDGKGEIYSRDLGKLTIDIIFKDSMGEVTPINAGEYIIEIASRNDALDRNYIINYETGSLVINRREITIEANIPEEYQQVIYSGNEYQFDPSWYKVVPEDGILEYDQALGLGVLKVQYYDEGQVEMNEVPVNAGNYYVRIIEDNHVLDDNYKVSYSENYTWFEIQRRDIYIKPIDQVYEYNGEIIIYDTSSWEYAGESEGNPLKQFVNLDTVTTITSTYIDIIDVGVYDIYVDSLLFEGYLESNYNIHCESGIVEITPREITIKPKDISIVYNGEYYSLGEEEYEVISDKKIASRDEGNLRIYVRFIDENNDQVDPIEVGEYVIEITGTNGALDHNYIINYETGKLEITQAEITIKPKDIEKTYDRELINQENIGYEGYEVVDGKGEIYSRDLGKLTIDIIFKDSMGEVTPINAGEYIIEIASRNDALDRNYIINYETGSLVINRREIIIQPALIEIEYGYDEDGLSINTERVEFDVISEKDIVSREEYESLIINIRFLDENGNEINPMDADVGTYYSEIVYRNDVLDHNYIINTEKGILNITPRTINIKPLDQVYEYNGKDIIYNDSDWDYDLGSKEFVNNDTVVITQMILNKDRIKDAGVYALEITEYQFIGHLESNYDINSSIPSTILVNKRPIKIEADIPTIYQEVDYDGNEYQFDSSWFKVVSDKDIIEEDKELGLLVTEVEYYNENYELLDHIPVDAGIYYVRISSDNGALNTNYSVSYSDAYTKFEILPRDIIIKPKDQTEKYTGSEVKYDTSSWEYAGESKGNPLKQFINMDTISITAVSDNPLINTGVYTLYVGEYQFVGHKESNYNISFETGTLTIITREVIIKPFIENNSKTYDGEEYVYESNKFGYDLKSPYEFAEHDLYYNFNLLVKYYDENYNEISNPINHGTYYVKAVGFEADNKDFLLENYEISYSDEDVQFKIEKREIKVKPVINETLTYNFNNQVFTYKWDYINKNLEEEFKFVGNDGIESFDIIIMNSRGEVFDSIKDAGTYYLYFDPSTVVISDNYYIDYESTNNRGRLTVNPLEITIEIFNKTRDYNGQRLLFEATDDYNMYYTVSGLPVDNVDITLNATYTGNTKNVGTYGVTIDQANCVFNDNLSTNFKFNVIDGTYVVNAVFVELQVDDLTKTYDGNSVIMEPAFINDNVLSGEIFANETIVLKYEFDVNGIRDTSVVHAGIYDGYYVGYEVINSRGIKETTQNYIVDVNNVVVNITQKDVYVRVLDSDLVYGREYISVIEFTKDSSMLSGDYISGYQTYFMDFDGNVFNDIEKGKCYVRVDLESIRIESSWLGSTIDDYNFIEDLDYGILNVVDVEVTLQLVSPSTHTYDGTNRYNINFIDQGLENLDGFYSLVPKFDFYDEKGNKLDGYPINAGTYKIGFSGEFEIVSLDGSSTANLTSVIVKYVSIPEYEILTINRANLTISGGIGSIVYDGEPYDGSIYSTSGRYSRDPLKFVNISFRNTKTNEVSSDLPINAGQYETFVDSFEFVNEYSYDNYKISTSDGLISIDKRIVNIKPSAIANNTGLYGEFVVELDLNNWEYTKKNEYELLAGHDIIITYNAAGNRKEFNGIREENVDYIYKNVITLTEAYDYKVYIGSAKFVDPANEDNYIIQIADEYANAYILQREISIRTGSAEKYFDGKELLETDNVELISGDLLTGHRFLYVGGEAAKIENYRTGTKKNTVEFAIVYNDEDGIHDVSGNYRIVNPEWGTLRVKPRPLEVVGKDKTTQFTGSAIKEEGFTHNGDGIFEEDNLPYLLPDSTIVIDSSKGITYVDDEANGKVGNNEFTVKITDKNNSNVTSCYDIHYTYGTITVTAMDLDVIFADCGINASLKYNGYEYDILDYITFVNKSTNKQYKWNGSLDTSELVITDENGDTYTSIYDAHTYTISNLNNLKLIDKKGVDRTINFNIYANVNDCLFVVNKVDLYIYSYSSARFWDGTGDLSYTSYGIGHNQRDEDGNLLMAFEPRSNSELVYYTVLPQYNEDGTANSKATVENVILVDIFDNDGRLVNHNFNFEYYYGTLKFDNYLNLIIPDEKGHKLFTNSDDYNYSYDEKGKYEYFAAESSDGSRYDNVKVKYYYSDFIYAGYYGEEKLYNVDSPVLPGTYYYNFIPDQYEVYISGKLMDNNVIDYVFGNIETVTYYIYANYLYIKPIDYETTYNGEVLDPSNENCLKFEGYDAWETISTRKYYTLHDGMRLYVTVGIEQKVGTKQSQLGITSYRLERLNEYGEWEVIENPDQYYLIMHYNGSEIVNQTLSVDDYKERYFYGSYYCKKIDLSVAVNEVYATQYNKVYDGEKININPEHMIHITESSLLPGHKLVINSVTTSGDMPRVYSGTSISVKWDVIDQNGKSVKKYYSLSCSKESQVEITKINLYIYTASASKVYDGERLYCTEIIKVEGLLDIHSIDYEKTTFKYSESSRYMLIYVGTVENSISKLYLVKTGTTTNVSTSIYNIIYNYGVLEVLPNYN